jgi:hypothetical protein
MRELETATPRQFTGAVLDTPVTVAQPADSEQEVSRRCELAVGRLSHKLLDADSPGGVARVLWTS